MVDPLRTSDLQARLGRAVRQLRRQADLTQEDLAAQAHMGWRHLQKIEAGEVNVTLSTISRLALALDVDPAELLNPGFNGS